ncbi:MULTISPECIES: hypothetical protein [unclassified Paenibacillus]
MNLAELILERAQQVPHRIAISDGQEIMRLWMGRGNCAWPDAQAV